MKKKTILILVVLILILLGMGLYMNQKKEKFYSIDEYRKLFSHEEVQKN